VYLSIITFVVIIIYKGFGGLSRAWLRIIQAGIPANAVYQSTQLDVIWEDMTRERQKALGFTGRPASLLEFDGLLPMTPYLNTGSRCQF
jgi:hypothetical protein